MPTHRQQMILLLAEQEMGARELSQFLGISEKEVFAHLSHIAKSVSAQKQRLFINPAACLSCGFTFKERNRTTRPSRCPRCRSERISDPTYRVK